MHLSWGSRLAAAIALVTAAGNREKWLAGSPSSPGDVPRRGVREGVREGTDPMP